MSVIPVLEHLADDGLGDVRLQDGAGVGPRDVLGPVAGPPE